MIKRKDIENYNQSEEIINNSSDLFILNDFEYKILKFNYKTGLYLRARFISLVGPAFAKLGEASLKAKGKNKNKFAADDKDKSKFFEELLNSNSSILSEIVAEFTAKLDNEDIFDLYNRFLSVVIYKNKPVNSILETHFSEVGNYLHFDKLIIEVIRRNGFLEFPGLKNL